MLVTGPTGSGKTTTLYSGARGAQQAGAQHLAEDPVEIYMRGINQVKNPGDMA